MATKSNMPEGTKRILRMRRRGMSYTAISRKLNEDEIPTNGRAPEWRPPVVRAICLRELDPAEERGRVEATKEKGAK